MRVVERGTCTKYNKHRLSPRGTGIQTKRGRRTVAPDHWIVEDSELSKCGIFSNLVFMPLMNSNNVIPVQQFISRSF